MNKESFVFYESVAKQGDRLADKLGKEVAFDFYKAVIDFGLYGVLPDEDSNVWLYGFEQTITSISAAKDRYNAAVENGKKGGRPKTVDADKVLELKQEGMTNKQVAERLGCSVSSIEKINAENRKNQKNPEITVIENQGVRKNGQGCPQTRIGESAKTDSGVRKNDREIDKINNINKINNAAFSSEVENPNSANIENQENRKNQKNQKNPNTAVVENRKNQKNLNVNVNVNVNDNKKEKDIFAFSWFDEEEEEKRKKKVVESAKDTRLAEIQRNRDFSFVDAEEQEYFDFIKGVNMKNGMSSAAAEADAWQMILDEREYNVSKIS